MTTILIKKLLLALAWLTARDAANAARKQARFKKQQAARAKVLAAARQRMYAKAEKYGAASRRCDTDSFLGKPELVKCEVAAACLSRQLKAIGEN